MQKARSQPSESRSPRQPPTACRHVVSGPLSLPAQGCFSPVPHGTRPLSVTRESLALEGGPPRFSQSSSDPPAYSGTQATQSTIASPTGLSPPAVGRSRPLLLTSLLMRNKFRLSPTTPSPYRGRFGLIRFRSPLLTESRLISLPPGT